MARYKCDFAICSVCPHYPSSFLFISFLSHLVSTHLQNHKQIHHTYKFTQYRFNHTYESRVQSSNYTRIHHRNHGIKNFQEHESKIHKNTNHSQIHKNTYSNVLYRKPPRAPPRPAGRPAAAHAVSPASSSGRVPRCTRGPQAPHAWSPLAPPRWEVARPARWPP
jgi:hypothetical protein